MQAINKNGLYLINEVPLLESIDNLEYQDNNTVKVRAKLQLLDVMNANKRIYTEALMTKHIELAQPLVKQKGLFGEFDHPDHDKPVPRIVTVKMKNASHVFHELFIEKEAGKTYVKGIVETIPSAYGFTLAAMYKKGLGVGFSLRSLGRVESRGGIDYASEPFKFVTYDAVANPSNEASFVEEILTEATCNLKECYLSESKVLTPMIEKYIEYEVQNAIYEIFA